MSLKDNMPTGFNKRARIETQEAAKFNFHKRVREQEEKKQLAEAVAKRMQEESEAHEKDLAKKKGK